MPDGRVARLDVPEGTTPDQVESFVFNGMKEATPAPRSTLGEIGRQVGLTARYGVEGLTALPNMAGDAMGLHSSQAVSDLLTKLGLPKPEGATERVVGDITRAMAGQGGTMKAGGILANEAGPVVQRIGDVLQSQPLMQAISSGTGAAAAGTTREKGGGAAAQTVAGLLGAAAPSVIASGGAAALRGIMRGGEEGRQRTAQNIDTFENAGTTPTVGQATESRSGRLAETMLGKTPGSAGVMAKKAEDQSAQISGKVGDLADSLSKRTGATQAGTAIKQGVIADGGFRQYFKERQGALYDQLDQHINKGTRIDVTNTKNALAELNAEIPGAPNTSKFFQNAKIGGIQGALTADTETAAGPISQLGPIQKQLMAQLPPAERTAMANAMIDGKLPYEALKKLRTLVGTEMADSSIVSDVPRSKWTALYGALSKDLGAAAEEAGPKATAAFERANSFTSAGMKRLETLDPILGTKDPEDIFRAATSGMQEGATTIRAVMRSLPEPAQKQVAATVLKRLGIANAGKQDATGEVFSPETFLTNWNKIGADSKQALFSKYGPEFTKNLDDVAKVASNLRTGSKIFSNPSGTEAALTSRLGIAGILYGLIFGHPWTAAALAGGMAGAHVGSKYLMTNPEFVSWLAKSTQAPSGSLPALLTSLANTSKSWNERDRAAAQDYISAARAKAQSGSAQQ